MRPYDDHLPENAEEGSRKATASGARPVMSRRDFIQHTSSAYVSAGPAAALFATMASSQTPKTEATNAPAIEKSGKSEIRILNNLWVVMPDGVRLSLRVALPSDAEHRSVPAILSWDPYHRQPDAAAARLGYASVVVDPRGEGNSEGAAFDEYAKQEQDDAVEVIAWIARQRWCNGNVGMQGISYSGFAALQVAARNPPALKAIFVGFCADDRYTDDAHYLGGCIVQDMFVWGSAWTGIPALKPDKAIVGPRWREMWLRRLASIDFFVGNWLEHQHRDAFWKQGSVDENYAAIRCPVYVVGGWVDGYNPAVGRLLMNLRVPRKGLIGPWTHGGGKPAPAVDLQTEAMLWFDHWLKGAKTKILEEPMMRAYLQDEPFINHRLQIKGRWVAEESWPSARIKSRTLYLTAEGIAEHAGEEVARVITSPQTVGAAAPCWVPFDLDTEGPVDQRIDDGRSMTFDGAPLSGDIQIWGTPAVTLDLSVDRPVAFLAVRLNEVTPDGSSGRVTYQVLNLTHRDSHESPSELTPDQRYRIRIPLRDCAYRFKKGCRLRVALSTTYWPLIWPSPESVTLTIYAGRSELELPVRPPREADGSLRALAASNAESATEDSATEKSSEPARLVTWDPRAKKLTIVNRNFAGVETSEIVDDDPTSARLTFVGNEAHPGSENEVRSTLLFSLTKEEFLLEGTLQVKDVGKVVLDRNWKRKIPRRMV